MVRLRRMGPLLQRVMAVVAGIVLLLASCQRSLDATERAWAEGAMLEMARVADVVTLKLLPAILGSTPGEQIPDWQALDAACADIDAFVPALRGVAREAPKRLEEAAQDLVRFARGLERFDDECHRAAELEDFSVLKAAFPDFVESNALIDRFQARLPEDVGCPDDIADRPQLCGA